MEIKFRGKQVDSGEWYVGFYAKGRHGGHYILSEYNGLATNAHSVDGYTVGRYTSLKDKRGMEIFEGDIVKRHGLIYRAKFGAGCFWLVRNLSSSLILIAKNCPHTEVIGNIHDNPEMLKEAAA